VVGAVRFVEHRIADRRVVRLIQKRLNAGVLEDWACTRREVGTVQGWSISPLLASLHLHYVLDLWVQRWRRQEAHGDVVVMLFVYDFVLGFERRADAERSLAALRERFARFGLTLHPNRTRLIELSRWPIRDRRARAEEKPESFNFLGFTHSCAKAWKGGFTVRRRTMGARWQAKLTPVKTELRRRRHQPVPELGA
jgi:RNA-directed DNA polymerase